MATSTPVGPFLRLSCSGRILVLLWAKDLNRLPEWYVSFGRYLDLDGFERLGGLFVRGV